MNQNHYRLIYSAHHDTVVPVAEFVRAPGSATVDSSAGRALAARPRGWALRKIWLALALALGLARLAQATLPTGGTVVSGQGAISQSATAMSVDQASQKMAINWQSFSVGKDNSVTFRQPNAQAIALNRVVGNDRSEIYGAINANGQVFLVNQNGILFGRTAEVNVGGLLASTRNISDEDFAAGKYQFTGSSRGEIINQGNLKSTSGGLIALVGAQVSNEGNISAQGGRVVMAAGESVRLTLDGADHLGVTVDSASLGALVDNKGLIAADGGTVVLTAKGKDLALDSAINMSGSIFAHGGTVVLDGGDSGVTQVHGGTIDVSGKETTPSAVASTPPQEGNGGTVILTGQYVGVLNGATINASGAASGGRVIVGGDLWGKVSDVKNDIRVADRTIFDAASTIDISSANGDGGFVETSGQSVAIDGTLIAQSRGKAGQWLIDPNDITITNSANANISTAASPWIGNTSSDSSTVSNTALGAALTGGATIEIRTNGTGNITVASAITAAGAGGLTLNAGTNINVAAAITFGDATKGSLTLVGQNVSSTTAGTINTSTGLTLNVNGTGGVMAGVISGTGSLTKLGSGNVSLSANNSYTGDTLIGNGTLIVSGAGLLGDGAYSGNIINNGTLQFSSTASQNQSGVISGTGNLIKTGSGALTLSGNNTYSGDTSITPGGDNYYVYANNSNAFGTGTVYLGQNLNTGYQAGLLVRSNYTIANSLVARIGTDVAGRRGGIALESGSIWAGDILLDNNGTFSSLFYVNPISTTAAAPAMVTGNISIFNASANAVTLWVRGNSYLRFTGNINIGNNLLSIQDTNNRVELAGAINNFSVVNSGSLYLGRDTTITGDAYGGGIIYLNNFTGNAFNLSIAGISNTSNTNQRITNADTTQFATLNLTGSGNYLGSGTVTGNINLVKSGSGNQTFTNYNTYNGSITVNAGLLNLATSQGSGAVVNGEIVNNGRLILNSTYGLLLNGNVSGSGNLTLMGNGVQIAKDLNLGGDLLVNSTGSFYTNANNIYAGNIDIVTGTATPFSAAYLNGGVLTASQGNISFNNDVVIAADATLSARDALNFNGTVESGAMVFADVGSWKYNASPGYIQYLLVGGGGAGGNGSGGGGGGGGLVQCTTSYALASGDYDVTVGAGGASNAANGANSSLGSLLLALGGGGAGKVGGSGGGAGYPSSGTAAGSAGTSGQGNAGGSGRAGSGAAGSGNVYCGGGGGGAGGAGVGAVSTGCGNGGAGAYNSITGQNIAYAGGGGGGADNYRRAHSQGTGGIGGGGDGGNNGLGNSGTPAVNGQNGTSGLGGGGGGGNNAGAGGAGGGGVVALRNTQQANLSIVAPAVHFSGNVSANTNNIINVLAIHDANVSGPGTVAATQLVINQSAGVGTWANEITGATHLQKIGAGTTVVLSNNSYAGTTTIDSGTLQVGNNTATGELGSGTIINNATLIFNRSGVLRINGVISGAGSLSQRGSGTTILSGNNNYSGITIVECGTLQVGANGVSGSLGSGDVVNNATLIFNRSNAIVIDNNVTGTGNFSAFAGADLSINSNLTQGGMVTLVAGKNKAAGQTDGGVVSIATGKQVNGAGVTVLTGNSTAIDTSALQAQIRINGAQADRDHTEKWYSADAQALAEAKTGQFNVMYRYAPSINMTVSNITDRTYDGTRLVNINYNTGASGLDGDVFDAQTAQGWIDSEHAGNRSLTSAAGLTSNAAAAGSNAYRINGYNITASNPNLSVTIARRDVSISARSGLNKTYGSADAANLGQQYTVQNATTAANGSLTSNFGLIAGDAATGNIGRENGENAGSYNFTKGSVHVGDAAYDDYNVIVNTAAAAYTITKKAISGGDLSNQSKVYGEDDGSSPIANITGIVKNANINVLGADGGRSNITLDDSLNITINYNLSREVGENIGSYNIGSAHYRFTGASSGNYEVNGTVNATGRVLTITARQLAINSISANSKTYDGTVNATVNTSSATYSGVVNRTVTDWNGNQLAINDVPNLTVNITGIRAEFADAHAGTDKAVAISNFTIAGAAVGNYNQTSATANSNATVYQRNVTVTTTAYNKTYGTDDLLGHFDVANHSFNSANLTNNVGLVAGDSFTGRLGRTANESGGSYNYTLGSLFAGNTSYNDYNIILNTSARYTIEKKEVNVTLANQTKIYGDNDARQTATTPWIATVDGWVQGVSVRSMGADGNMSNVVIDDSAVYAGAVGREAGEQVGSYNLTAGNLNIGTTQAGNYKLNVTLNDASMNITPRTLNVSIANMSKIYGDDDPILANVALTLGGIVSKTISYYNANGAYVGVAVSDTGKVGAQITQINRDAGETVGSYNITVLTVNATPTGDAAANYLINTTVNTSDRALKITARPVGLTGVTVSDKTYDGSSTATINTDYASVVVLNNHTVKSWYGNTTINDAGQADFDSGNITGSFDNVHAGVRNVSLGGSFALSGSAAANYIGQASSSDKIQATIEKRQVDLNAVYDSKVYDGTTSSTATPVGAAASGNTGLLAGDTITGVSQSFASVGPGQVALTPSTAGAGISTTDTSRNSVIGDYNVRLGASTTGDIVGLSPDVGGLATQGLNGNIRKATNLVGLGQEDITQLLAAAGADVNQYFNGRMISATVDTGAAPGTGRDVVGRPIEIVTQASSSDVSTEPSRIAYIADPDARMKDNRAQIRILDRDIQWVQEGGGGADPVSLALAAPVGSTTTAEPAPSPSGSSAPQQAEPEAERKFFAPPARPSPIRARTLVPPVVREPGSVRRVPIEETIAAPTPEPKALDFHSLDPLIDRIASGRVKVTALNIVGYTDAIGADAANQKISEETSDAAMDYIRNKLVERGVTPPPMSREGRGEANPLTDCSGTSGDELRSCLRPNRRVEVSIKGYAG
jgi:filamentous hemagglutinin family protein